MSLGCACNFFNEHNALPGFLESAAQYFDDIVMVNAGPGGKRSDDGSIEIVEKFGARLLFDTIDEGFGSLRTRLIRATTTEFTMILDADERFHPLAPALSCHGEEAYPAVEKPNLSVKRNGEVYSHGTTLKEIIGNPEIDGVILARRHWFDFSHTRPCQNWQTIADWQFRIVRNCEHVIYRPEVRMHERIVDVRTGEEPRAFRGNQESGPFFDHYHCFFKPMEPAQREEDIRIYNALCDGSIGKDWPCT